MYSCRLIMLEGLFSLLFYCESGINQYAGQKTSIDVFGTSMLSLGLGWLRYIGLFQKQTNRGRGGRGGWRKHFFENSPGVFRFFALPLEISDKLKIQPLEIESIVLHLSTPGNSNCYFFKTPGNSISSTPLPLSSSVFFPE